MLEKYLNFHAFSPQRRKFLLAGGAAMLLSGLGWAGHRWLPLRPPNSPAEIAALILACTGTGPGMRQIGKMLQKQSPETTLEEVVRNLIEDWPEGTLASRRAVRAQLEKEIRQDFLAGRIREINSWLYAETEAEVMLLHGVMVRHAG